MEENNKEVFGLLVRALHAAQAKGVYTIEDSVNIYSAIKILEKLVEDKKVTD